MVQHPFCLELESLWLPLWIPFRQRTQWKRVQPSLYTPLHPPQQTAYLLRARQKRVTNTNLYHLLITMPKFMVYFPVLHLGWRKPCVMYRYTITKSFINHLWGIMGSLFSVTITVFTQNISWLNTIFSYRDSIL